MADTKPDQTVIDLTAESQPAQRDSGFIDSHQTTSFSVTETNDGDNKPTDNYREEDEQRKRGLDYGGDSIKSDSGSVRSGQSSSGPSQRKSGKRRRDKVLTEISGQVYHQSGTEQQPVTKPNEVAVGITDLLDEATKKLRRLSSKETSGNHSHSFVLTDGDPNWKTSLETFTSKIQVDLRSKPKRVRSYYEAQNDLISAYENLAKDIPPTDDAPAVLAVGVSNAYDKALLFSKITLLINVLLLIAKAVASVLSGSMSIISSLVDSCLDLFSGIIMWWATRSVKNRDPYIYPQGRTKLEPVAVVILAVVMGLCSILLIRESVEKVISLIGDSASLPNVDYVTFAIAGSTVVTKLILWLVCRRVNSSIVQALAQDHRNDVLSNAVAIICGYLGSGNFMDITGEYELSYIDPAGAILISLYIIFNWWQTGSEQIKLLTGHTAKPDFLSQLTWVCINHHPQINHIDTVRAFHFGSNFLVEVDIVLPEKMTLQQAHNIGESLQQRLERIPEVERAFVHLDYEFSHNPHTEHKIV